MLTIIIMFRVYMTFFLDYRVSPQLQYDWPLQVLCDSCWRVSSLPGSSELQPVAGHFVHHHRDSSVHLLEAERAKEE